MQSIYQYSDDKPDLHLLCGVYSSESSWLLSQPLFLWTLCEFPREFSTYLKIFEYNI